MELKKYLLVIVGFIISIVVFATIYVLSELMKNNPQPLIPKEYITDFVVIIPSIPCGSPPALCIPGLFTDIPILYLIPIIVVLVIYALGPYLLVIYLQLHKLSTKISTKTEYGIVEPGTKVGSLKLFRRALTVSLFAFSICALIVQAGYGAYFRGGYNEDLILHKAEALFLGTFFISGIVLIIFIPIWLLEDTGIVGYKHDKSKRHPPKIEGISSLYSSILEGYAGISTIFILISYIFGTLAVLSPGSAAILTPIILIFLPFIITGLFAIPLMIYEALLPKATKRIHKKLRKYNLHYIDIPEFNEVKSEKTIVID